MHPNAGERAPSTAWSPGVGLKNKHQPMGAQHLLCSSTTRLRNEEMAVKQNKVGNHAPSKFAKGNRSGQGCHRSLLAGLLLLLLHGVEVHGLLQLLDVGTHLVVPCTHKQQRDKGHLCMNRLAEASQLPSLLALTQPSTVRAALAGRIEARLKTFERSGL